LSFYNDIQRLRVCVVTDFGALYCQVTPNLISFFILVFIIGTVKILVMY